MNKNYKPKWKNRDRFVVNLVCFVIILSFTATQFQCRLFFFTYLTRAHTGISCLAKCCSHPFLSNTGSLFLSLGGRGLTGLA